MKHSRRLPALSSTLAAWVVIFGAMDMAAQVQQAPAPQVEALKQLSLDELFAMEITSVSRRQERLVDAAAAIQVVTAQDIHRSGATRLPEALRLASNLQVAQVDSSQWAISARGFNSPLANKLLVMIDGRTVYSPLFAGVFWDIQDVPLEDVERIEVISGPGATLWGANAVNGVINVTTKPARDAQGWLVEGGVGTELQSVAGIRYGGRIAPNAPFRVYGRYSDRDGTVLSNGQDVANDRRHVQGGARLDLEPSDADLVTLQGDLYENRMFAAGVSDPVTRGGNLLARWTRRFATNSDLQVQIYFDRVHRDVPGSYNDVLDTWDADLQHRFPLATRHDVVWGAGFRLVEDDFEPGTVALVPRRLSLRTFSAFLQDEIALVPEELHLTLGTKVEHNEYTGIEWQPGVRVAWNVRNDQTWWAALSRALRTPSRLDRDLIVPPVFAGGPDFESEELFAYEVGWRAQLHERVSVALATFYHDYDGIRSVEPADPPAPLPSVVLNGQRGQSYGAELTVDYHVTDAWRLRVGWSELRVSVRPKAGSADQSFGRGEAADSKHYLHLRSSVDLPGNWECDAGLRWVSRITNPMIEGPVYGELDLRLAWRPTPAFELSVVGQNLLHDGHTEFSAPLNTQEIERSVFGRIAWRH